MSFTIDLVPNDTWNNTLEFFVELLPGRGAQALDGGVRAMPCDAE